MVKIIGGIRSIREVPGFRERFQGQDQEGREDEGGVRILGGIPRPRVTPPTHPAPSAAEGFAPRVREDRGELQERQARLTPDRGESSFSFGESLSGLFNEIQQGLADRAEAEGLEPPEISSYESVLPSIIGDGFREPDVEISTLPDIQIELEDRSLSVDQDGYTSVLAERRLREIEEEFGTLEVPRRDTLFSNRVGSIPRRDDLPGREPRVEEDGVLEFVAPTENPDIIPQIRNRERLPVSIRNNNPGGISIIGKVEGSFAARQPGFVGTTNRPRVEGGKYAKFATPQHGIAAASRLLESYGRRGINTPTKIVSRWATGGQLGYINTIVRYLNRAGIEATKDSELDLSDPAVRVAVLKAQSDWESGMRRPVYKDKVFEDGANYRLP